MKLEGIKNSVEQCQRCKLYKTRTKAVPGKGNFNAEIIFVGEAPGRSEDKLGEPFVGAAGKKLSTVLEKAGIQRDDVYITNVVKCRPPENRTPLQNERDSCSNYLESEIDIIKPNIICVMGNTAFGSLLNGSDIMKFRGSVFSKEGKLYFISLHPAAAIYNQKLIYVLEEDMKRLVAISQKIKNGKKVKIDHEITA